MVACRFPHTFSWQRLWVAPALWVGPRALSPSRDGISTTHLALPCSGLRTYVLAHHTPRAPMPRTLQRWLFQPRQRARCWPYLWQWCSYSFARINVRGFDIIRIGIRNHAYRHETVKVSGLPRSVGEFPLLSLSDFSRSSAGTAGGFKLSGGAVLGGTLLSGSAISTWQVVQTGFNRRG